ncbi:MAG: hypothetical protein WC966_01700 [Bradymonadales bacterium]|jgi:hypothetical protein
MIKFNDLQLFGGKYPPTRKLPSKLAKSRYILCAVSAKRRSNAQNASLSQFFGRSCATPSLRKQRLCLQASTLLALLFFAAFAFSACAIEDGRAWGVIDAKLEAKVDIGSGRWDDSLKAYRSSDDRRVRIKSIKLHLSEFGLSTGGENTGKLSFDPTNPPPPYTNCHSDHCHLPDSSIISYDEIEKILQQSGSNAKSLLTLAVDRELVLFKDDLPVTSGFEALNVEVNRGKYDGLVAKILSVELELSVYENELWVSHVLESKLFDKPVFLSANYQFGEDKKYRQNVGLALELGISFIDKVAWSKLGETEELDQFWTQFTGALKLKKLDFNEL